MIVRPIDADAMSKSIVEDIRLAEEWEKESTEMNDECGLRYAANTYNNLLAMLHRVQEQPTIEIELPVTTKQQPCAKWIPREYNGYADELPVWDL